MKKKLLMVRDIPLSILAGHAVYSYPDWANTASAVYCGIVVVLFCGCSLIAINEWKRKLRQRKRREKQWKIMKLH